MAFGRTRPLLVRWSAAIGVAVSCIGALWIFQAYDKTAAGFQFGERFDLVPSLGIAYELAADGMSVVMVLLTAIIILAGVFASWTVKSRDPPPPPFLFALPPPAFGVLILCAPPPPSPHPSRPLAPPPPPPPPAPPPPPLFPPPPPPPLRSPPPPPPLPFY
jgi:drug/metabolite transporter (DMT)-like permease